MSSLFATDDAAVRATCVTCGGQGPLLDFPGAAAVLARCQDCGLVFNRDWAESFNAEMYDYYTERLGWPEERIYNPLNIKRLEGVLRDLAARVPNMTLLDVGCGVGTLVYAAVRQGWQAQGIDLSRGAIEVGQRFGLPCRELDFFDPQLSNHRFDVIVMSEFIEHVPHPDAFLARARSLLADSGAVYITTPNFNSLGRRVLKAQWRAIHPEHLSYFTPATLRGIAARAGLRIERLSTTNISLPALRKMTGRPVKAATGQSLREEEQEYRASVERSWALRAVKNAVNVGLNATNLGESMKALLRGR